MYVNNQVPLETIMNYLLSVRRKYVGLIALCSSILLIDLFMLCQVFCSSSLTCGFIDKQESPQYWNLCDPHVMLPNMNFFFV